MKLILEIEAPEYLRVKDYARLKSFIEFLGLKIKRFTTVENYKFKIIA